MKPHKWQKEIIAWANGETIQSRAKGLVDWYDCDDPRWFEGYEYRIKPKEFKWQKEKDHWEKGGIVQFLSKLDNKWDDYPYSIRDLFSNNYFHEQPDFWGTFEWRIKPKEDSLQKEKEHWKNGGDVQYYNPYEKQWFDLINKPNCEPDWDGLFTVWRIKPKEFKWQKEKDHWEKGGKIQYGKAQTGVWHDFLYGVETGLNPDWSSLEWRIKPEESKIEYSFNDQVRDEIESILDCFDFQRVLEVMNALDWTYWHTNGVPEIWDIRKEARTRLKEAVTGLIRSGEKRYFSSSGGFHAEAEIEDGNPKIYLTLRFVVSEWSNWE